LALVALRQGRGNIDLAGELLRTIYLTYFLADGEAQTTSQDLFASAECAIKTTIAQSVMTGEWCLEDSHTRCVGAVLRTHDAQLSSLPTHLLDGAKQRLTRLLEAGNFPSLVATP
jgi:hypothetical protein